MEEIHELPPGLEFHFQRIRRIWTWALATPTIYLALACLFKANDWMPLSFYADPRPAAHPMAGGAIGAIALGCIAALGWLGRRRRIEIETFFDLPPEALRRWVRTFYSMAVAADSLALLGLLYYVMTGVLEGLMAGWLAGYAGYLVSKPRREDLEGLEDVVLDEGVD